MYLVPNLQPTVYMYSTVQQYSFVVHHLQMCSKQKRKEGHGHKKAHATRAL